MKVLVGNTSAPAVFYVHRKKLCDTTKIFTAALQKGYIMEGVENTISLSEQEPATIRSFIHWLYERDLVKNHSEGKDTGYFHRLIKLYIFADVYRIVPLRLKVLHFALDEIQAGRVTPDNIKFAYKAARPGCSLRKMCSDHLGLARMTWVKTRGIRLFTGCPKLVVDLMLAASYQNPVAKACFRSRSSRKARDAYLALLD